MALWQPWKKAPQTLVVARQDLREMVEVSGSVEAAASVGLKAEATGVVEALLLPENQRASQGTLLMRLRPTQAQLQLNQSRANATAAIAQAQSQVRSAKATLREVESRQNILLASLQRRVNKVAISLAHLEADLLRYEALAAEGGVSDQSLAAQRQQRDQARQDLGLARDEVARQRNGTEAVSARNALAQAQTALANALRQGQASVALSQKALADTQVQAPFDGTVTDWLVEPGLWVTPGTPLAQFQDLKHLRLRLPVDELDLPKLRLGGPVAITFDAYPEQEVSGTIARISKASVTGNSNVQVFPVEVTFTDPQDRIRPGMSADAKMLVRELRQVLALPLGAVRRQMERFMVTVVVGGKRVEREVVPGVSTLDAVQILSGLSEGELVEDPNPNPSPKPSAKP